MTRSPARSTTRSRRAAVRRPAASCSTSPRACRPRRSSRRLPSMYHQFKELADVDITKEPMEVGPTCHYVMGGVEVDPDSGAAFGTVQGLFAAGEVSGGMHGSNRLGGNSLSDLLVFGKRAGEHASTYVDDLGDPPDGGGGRRRGRRGRGARAAVAGHRREPVHAAAGSAGRDGRPGRHHPPPGRARGRPGPARRAARAGGQRRRDRRPPLQPGLAPRARPAQHAGRLGVHREGGAGAGGVARRSHPRGLPADGSATGGRSTWSARWTATRCTWSTSRCRGCGPS